MEQRLNVVTLGVAKLPRALRFYRDGLGWTPALEMGDFALFDLGGAALALYPRRLLADDAGTPGGRVGAVTLAQNVRTREDVDRVLAAAVAAGAALLRPASEKEWGGYSGYFADPDGHPWEVAWAPQFRLDRRGRLVLPRRRRGAKPRV